MQRRLFLIGMASAGAPSLAADAMPNADVWGLLRGGAYVILLRHAATVPGIGDPAGFALAQCATQRNLSQAGRADARKIGQALQSHGIPIAAVLSSRWCRCLDTARLAFGRAEPAPMLDSMFRDQAEASEEKLRQVRAYCASLAPKAVGNTVMVTHDVNIRALVGRSVGRSVGQGEMVVAAVEPGGALRVVAQLTPGPDGLSPRP